MVPPSSRGDGTPRGTGGPRQDPDFGEVVEQYNAPLPPHDIVFFHGRPIYLYVSVWRLCDHPTSAHRYLAPSGSDRFLHTCQSGVSRGLVQDQCDLDG